MVIKKNSLNIILLLSMFAIIQIFIDYSYANIISTLICLIMSIIGILYIKNTLNKGYFLSLVVIASVILSTQLGPLVFQTLYLNPVNFNLRMSYLAFMHTAFMLMGLIIGHFIYVNSKFFNTLRLFIHDGFKNKLRLFDDISGGFVFLLTFLAFFAVYFGGVNDIETGDVGGKSLAILGFFTMLPLAYFYQGIQNNKRSRAWYFTILGIYFFALILLGFLRNSRGMFADFALCFIFILFYFIYSKKIIITKKVFLIGLLSIIPLTFFMNLLSLVSGAILINRSIREDTRGIELISSTLDTMLQILTGEINRGGVGVNANVDLNSYNELYIYNDFLSRLITVKFDDNILFYSQNIGLDKYFEVNIFYFDRLISLLPQPVINFFTSDFDKSNYMYSYGDWVNNLSVGGALSSFKLGSVSISGYNLFGYFFYIVVIFTVPVLFSLIDAMEVKYKNIDHKYRVYLSVMAILLLKMIFMLFNGDSIMGVISFVLRYLWQFIFAYCFFLFLYNFLLKLLRNN